jgi:hypothetical protein
MAVALLAAAVKEDMVAELAAEAGRLSVQEMERRRWSKEGL